jgi:hypothetical protein
MGVTEWHHRFFARISHTVCHIGTHLPKPLQSLSLAEEAARMSADRMFDKAARDLLFAKFFESGSGDGAIYPRVDDGCVEELQDGAQGYLGGR